MLPCTSQPLPKIQEMNAASTLYIPSMDMRDETQLNWFRRMPRSLLGRLSVEVCTEFIALAAFLCHLFLTKSLTSVALGFVDLSSLGC